VSDLLTRLRARGWHLTAQRRAVAEVLHGEHLHLTADEIHERAVGVLPEISRATVYNTLRELVEMGEVLELSADGKARRFDPNVTETHQHLVCRGCGALFDVPSPDVSELAPPRAHRHGFTIDAVEIVYRGLCPSCQAEPVRPPDGRRPAG